MLDKTAITKTAQKFTAKGQIDKAIAEWDKLIKESQDGNVYNIVGDLYLKKKAKRDAVDAFSKAAAIFREDGFFLKSIALYKKILNIAPLEVDALVSLAELNAEKGLIGNANENFLAAAEIYIKAGETEKALEIYEEILKLAPSNINLKMKVSDLYIKMGLKEEAAKEYVIIAGHYQEKGESDKAQEFYLKAFGFNPKSVTALTGLSTLAEKAGDNKQAYEYLNQARSIDPDNLDVLFSYAGLALDTGDLDGAKQTLTKLIEKDPSDNRYKKLIGTIYLKEGSLGKSWEFLLPCIDEALGASKWSEAIELLGNFKEADPVEVKRRLVTAYKGTNDKDAAVKELKALSDVYEKKALTQNAIKTYKEILQLSPSDGDAQARIEKLEAKLEAAAAPPAEDSFEKKSVEEILTEVDEYTGQGLLDKAISLLDRLKGKVPHNMEVHVRLKDIYVNSEEKDKAIGACLAIAEIYERKGDLDAKNKIIAEAASLNPDDPRLVTVSMSSPDIEEVKASPGSTVKKSVEADGDNLEEQMEEAEFYVQQGLTDEAVDLYEKLLAGSPDNNEIRQKLSKLKSAVVREGKSVEKDAEQREVDSGIKDIFHEFKKGIEEELGGEDSETRYNLGIAYKEMGLLEDAIREFKVSAKDPKRVFQSSSMLSMCYMEKKLYPLAIQEFKKVLESLSPSDEGYLGVKCDLADAYVKNKDYKNSLQLYTEIHSQDPNFRDVARKVEIIKKLAAGGKDKPKAKKDRVSYI